MSYDAPPPPPPGYGPPGGYGAPPKTSGKAIAALVTGILGIFPCAGCGVFGVAAVILGSMARNEIAASNGTLTGGGLAKAGFICGVVGLALFAVYWILVTTNTIDFTGYQT